MLSVNESDLMRLFREHQPRLLACLQRRLRSRGRDEGLADEVAQMVWSRLADPATGLLPRYDPKRGPFLSYLKGLSVRTMANLERAERRRRAHESRYDRRPRTATDADDGTPGSWIDRFLGWLTPCEREFIQVEVLGFPAGPAYVAPSPAHQRKLRQSVREKMLAFVCNRLATGGDFEDDFLSRIGIREDNNVRLGSTARGRS